MKRQIEAMRLKTIMAECFRDTKLPYPTQRQNAIEKIKALQEEYKALTGEYHPDFIVNEMDEAYSSKDSVLEPYNVMWTDKDGHKFSAKVDAFVTAQSLKDALSKSPLVRECTYSKIEKK